MNLSKIVYEREKKKTWDMNKESMGKKLKNTKILLLETAVKIFLFVP